MNFLKMLLLEYKDVFAWIYKDLKCILLELAQHHIELDTSIPLAHQTKYIMNPNNATLFVTTLTLGLRLSVKCKGP
jgi:hypothetical protein